MTSSLFTPRFFVMCAFTFTVFVSLFQLLPAAPYHVLALGGTTLAGGLFLGFLTYASALSAPFTGQIADRVGHRRVLIVVSLVLAGFSTSYAFLPDYRIMLGVVFVHGLFWSGLLAASGAYITSIIPEQRRAEGIGYWGLSSIIAIGTAPALGFWVFQFGWTVLCLEIAALNLLMALIAWRLPDDPPSPDARDARGFGGQARPIDARGSGGPARPIDARGFGGQARPIDARGSGGQARPRLSVEWPVLWLSVTMTMIAFGYGGLTTFSALFADSLQAYPRSLFLTAMAGTMLLGRLTVGRQLDRLGHRRVMLPCLWLTAAGMSLLVVAQGTWTLAVAGVAFGAGFGLLYPSYTAYIMSHVPAARRGAAFGAMLAAFDVGVGTGSTTMGGLIHQFGYRTAFGLAAGLACLAVPYFVMVERRLGFVDRRPTDPGALRT